MNYAMEVSFEGDHILARISGEDNYEASYDMLSKIVDACKQHDCYNILGIADLTPLTVEDAFDHAEMFIELGITTKYRIAWYDKNADARKSLDFCEMVLKNRGMLNGGNFATEDEARKWLLSPQPQ